MTKELLPELGSGALREALDFAAVLRKHWLAGITCHHAEIPGDESWDRASCACSEVDFPKAKTVGEAVEMWIQHVLVVAALSLSSPIEPTSVEHGVTVDYVAGQEREAASARLVARERGYTIPDDWTSQEVIRHITGWPAQPSQASSEIREARVAALNEAIDAINSVRFVFQRSSWADALEKVMELRDRALAPSRQGAGGK